ncbi:MAG: hypothetical protein ABEN55_21030 [Bradymonadaceae bacterium]
MTIMPARPNKASGPHTIETKADYVTHDAELEELNQLEEDIRERIYDIGERLRQKLFAPDTWPGIDAGYEDPWDVVCAIPYGPAVALVFAPSSAGGYEGTMEGWAFGYKTQWEDGLVRGPATIHKQYSPSLYTRDRKEVKYRLDIIDMHLDSYTNALQNAVFQYLQEET